MNKYIMLAAVCIGFVGCEGEGFSLCKPYPITRTVIREDGPYSLVAVDNKASSYGCTSIDFYEICYNGTMLEWDYTLSWRNETGILRDYQRLVHEREIELGKGGAKEL